MDIETLRKLVALDENDPLSRFGLGQKLSAVGETDEELREACEHLLFANEKDPEHIATYHVLAQVLIRLSLKDEAREVLTTGRQKAAVAPPGMGNDLEPVLAEMLESL
jgi:predicted Zn-dependent protease